MSDHGTWGRGAQLSKTTKVGAVWSSSLQMSKTESHERFFIGLLADMERQRARYQQ